MQVLSVFWRTALVAVGRPVAVSAVRQGVLSVCVPIPSPSGGIWWCSVGNAVPVSKSIGSVVFWWEGALLVGSR